jgi:hypothetical protein
MRRLCQWLFYRPGTRGDQSCSKCCEPCHPPLYAWFPCAGNGGCSSCESSSGNGCPRVGGIIASRKAAGHVFAQGCSSSDGRLAKFAKGCAGHGGKCADGQCGEYRFAYLGREKFLYSNGAAQSCHSGGDAGPIVAGAVAPEPTTPPATIPAPTAPPATDAVPMQSTSYKQDPDVVTAPIAAPKLPTTNRMTTYRPDAVKPTMPVLSPDQFRKPKK